jgi:hypothetical protein
VAKAVRLADGDDGMTPKEAERYSQANADGRKAYREGKAREVPEYRPFKGCASWWKLGYDAEWLDEREAEIDATLKAGERQ